MSPRSSLLSGGWPWLVAVLCCGACGLPLAADDTGTDDGAERHVLSLGFAFDQKAHDDAVAAEAARVAAIENKPDDPPHPGVIRLARYLVNDDRVPIRDSELLTPAGRVEVAKKRYLSPIYRKTLGPLAAVVSLLANPLGGWNPNGAEAMALYEQDQQRGRNLEMNDLQELEDMPREPASKE